MRTRPRRSASWTSSAASSEVAASGFSTSTCLPAFSAPMASSKWEETEVATATASMLASSASSAHEEQVWMPG